MHFKRLRLSGFKSFVDPVDLDILPGLTGVVGPNGCGKSNLLEALRWAMGETSYKSMRGSGMEDVIFSGTTARPARNHAEVGLYLDNVDHDAPSEYNDNETIEVIRRIEREAGSAYRVNGRDVRAKDVQLLFADASTGARSTALVRQGQIGELINAKPESRRRILEEAAGISGLHSRRHEAELRLRAAEGNLEKVDEALGQMDTNLRSLRRQARQATRYRGLSGEIRQAEALALHLRWQSIVDQLAEINAELDAARQDVNTRTQAAAAAATGQAQLQASLPPLREAEANAAAGLRRLTIERDNLDSEEARAKEMIARLQRQHDDLEADKQREMALLSDAQLQLETLVDESKTLLSEVQDDEAESEARARKACDAAGEKLEASEAELDVANRAVADFSAKRNALMTTKESAQSRIARLQSQIDERQSMLNGLLQAELPLSEDAQLLQHRDQVLRKVEDASETLEALSNDVRLASERVDALVSPLREAQEVVARLVGERSALSAMFARPGEKSYPSLVDALDVEAGYEMALGAALGDDLDASSDEEAPAHWRLLEQTSPDIDLPVGIEPLSNFVKGAKALTRRLHNIGIVRDKSDVRAMQERLATGQRLVSLDGDLWRWDGYCAAAEAPTAAAQRLAQRNRLQDLVRELEAAEKQAQARDEEMSSLKEKHRNIVALEKEAVLKLETYRKELSEAREALANAERGRADFATKKTAFSDALVQLTADFDEQSQLQSVTLASLAELDEAADPQIRVDELRQLVAEGRAALSEARAAFDQLRTRRQLRESRLRRISEDKVSWEKRIEAAGGQISSLTARSADVVAELARVSEQPEQLGARKQVLLNLIQEAETKRKGEADTLAEAENALRAADKTARETQGALIEAREGLARLEANKENAGEREAEASQRIREILQVEPEMALGIAAHDPNKTMPAVHDVEAKLEKLRRERETLGGVNLRADEEASEIEKQMADMKAERDDLASAINKLRYGIGQLNKEGRERLLAAYESVNTHFSRLFTQLFGGGTARLELTESDDPLEAGLEIIAHPPGKKPQLMSLLSGGEQALTAMAMIFAVFLTNPSPICVLDEVDAPLDDANVERYCNMIREISEATGTRFLLITHHALTMARVDRLYGVTMQERGVSTLISVDLKEAEQFADAGGSEEEIDAFDGKINA